MPGVSVNKIRISDIHAIIRDGFEDFLTAPGLSMAIASVYTIGGWLLIALLVVFEVPYLVYPLAMGFALIAPFVAVAFYAVSRALSRNETPTLSHVFAETFAARHRDLRWMALVTAFSFFIWIDIAAILTLSFFGSAALDFPALLQDIMTTYRGWTFLVVGHVIGALIALLVFSVSVVTFPMLFDRDVDVITAMATSVKLLWQNPCELGLWCFLIAISIAGALATGLLLMPVVLPVLGYASWHLYIRATSEAIAAPPPV